MQSRGEKLLIIEDFHATDEKESVWGFSGMSSNFIDDVAFAFLGTSSLILALGQGLISINGLLKYAMCGGSNVAAGDVTMSSPIHRRRRSSLL
jgi:hypothetical protein